MNKVFLYLVFIISYVLMEKTFFPEDYGVQYIKTVTELEPLIEYRPASIILTNIHKKGFLFKSYYLQLRIVYPNYPAVDLIVKTKKKFAEINEKYLGMSIYQIDESGSVKALAMPPGMIFVGNRTIGKWVRKEKKSYWEFYRAYDHLPEELGWMKFEPSIDFYQRALEKYREFEPFYGLEKEFGLKGSVTKQAYSYTPLKDVKSHFTLKNIGASLFKFNY
jgi:hypothetical protein